MPHQTLGGSDALVVSAATPVATVPYEIQAAVHRSVHISKLGKLVALGVPLPFAHLATPKKTPVLDVHRLALLVNSGAAGLACDEYQKALKPDPSQKCKGSRIQYKLSICFMG